MGSSARCLSVEIEVRGGQIGAAGFGAETKFQALVAETFDQVLATQSEAPAVVAREVAMPDGGRVDILAVDADAARPTVMIQRCRTHRAPRTAGRSGGDRRDRSSDLAQARVRAP